VNGMWRLDHKSEAAGEEVYRVLWWVVPGRKVRGSVSGGWIRGEEAPHNAKPTLSSAVCSLSEDFRQLTRGKFGDIVHCHL
jgi:hypothetical protein